MGKVAAILSGGSIVPATPIDYTQVYSVHNDGTRYYVNSKSLLRVLTFESPSETARWTQEFAGANSFALDNTVYKNFRYSGRFELNKTDADVSGSKRAEMVCDTDLGQERWYGFSQYFPSSFTTDTEGEIVGQWHVTPDFDLGETWRQPPISIQVYNDNLKIAVLWASAPLNTDATKDGIDVYELGSLPKDTWIDWVFHIKFSYQNDGILEVWKNGVKVIIRIGQPNCYNDQHYPFFKIGIYKWIWKENPTASLVSQRVLYYDEVRIGNENATYNDVAPN